MDVTNAPAIQRKDDVPEEYRTDDRDAAAEYITEEVVEEGRWPVTMTQIANETGYSRQHIKNVLEYYFEATRAKDEPPRQIEVPEDVDAQSYLRGFIDGYRDAVE